MNILNQFFNKVAPLPVGTYHLQTQQDQKPYRLHLRLQKDGSGLLILNAATVMQLNPTAAECAYHYIKGSTPQEAARQAVESHKSSTGQIPERVPLAALDALVQLETTPNGYRLRMRGTGAGLQMDEKGQWAE